MPSRYLLGTGTLITRQIPDAIQNISISATNIAVVLMSFFFTFFIVLPWATFKPFVMPFVDKGRMNSPDGARLKSWMRARLCWWLRLQGELGYNW
ncbi:hypothetical protein BJ165DRAFT_1479074 [Panaeolus papilionaceus]|nr:hypothetical protein BJ165DRAFT_1479074 [Panaeolus papilionaceus]